MMILTVLPVNPGLYVVVLSLITPCIYGASAEQKAYFYYTIFSSGFQMVFATHSAYFSENFMYISAILWERTE